MTTPKPQTHQNNLDQSQFNEIAPLIVTMGDPAGIGPEICAGVLCSRKATHTFSVRYSTRNCTDNRDSNCTGSRDSNTVPHDVFSRPIVVFGSRSILEKASRFVDPAVREAFSSIAVYKSLDEYLAEHKPGDQNSITAIERGEYDAIIDFDNVSIPDHQPGRICAEYGRAAYDYICCAIDNCMAGKAAGVVTAPIHKVAFHQAGVPFPGHTELFASRTGSENICMVLSCPELTTALVTAHVGLNQVPQLITQESVRLTIELVHDAWLRILDREPRITVLGLNPHAGENGLFGNNEEEKSIIPVISELLVKGYSLSGPIPPDTGFIPAKRAKTDVYICMYHDQGLIPMKMLGFDSGVNLTLGLPIVRTSVDHGTAMDIAFGRTPNARPNTSSMLYAIEVAEKLARIRQVAAVDF